MLQWRLSKGLVWCLCLLLPLGSKAQEYVMQHRVLSVEDGLSSRFVRKVIQDRQGFIWIATSEGLNRYDGIEIQYYSKEQHGLPANDLNLLHEGPTGLLWVGSWNPKDQNGIRGGGVRLSFFNSRTEKNYSFREYLGDRAPFSEEELFGIHIDASHKAWLGTRSGKAYSFDGQEFQLLLDNQGAFPVSYALPADGRSFWVLGPNALLRMDGGGAILERNVFREFTSIPSRIIPLRNGGILVEASDFMKIKYPGQALAQLYRLPGGGSIDVSAYQKIAEGPRGWLWCFTADNLKIFDSTGQLVADFSGSRFSFEPWLVNLFIDTDELAWITLSKDLLLLDIRENVFRPYLTGKDISLRSMAQLEDSKVWVNSYDGMYLLDMLSGEANALFDGKKLAGLGNIRTRDGSLWIGLHGGKAAYVNLDSNTFEQFPIITPGGLKFDPLQPFIDSSGKLWMGTTGGLAHFDASAGKYVFDQYLNQPQLLGGKACFWFHETPEGIWIATSEGLFLLHLNGRQLERIGQLPAFHIFHIYPESNTRFWLSARGGGLIRWDRAQNTFRQFTVRDGLSSNIIYAAYPDKQGYLWLPSQSGLMRFDTASHIVRTFYQVNGLPANEFNYYAHLRLDDGRLLFGTTSGLAAFNPEEVSGRNSENTELGILKVQQFNSRSGSMEDITGEFAADRKIALAPGRRFVVAHFFLNDYFNPEKNRYFVKIEGLDSEWQAIKEPQITIGQLPWGRYTLRVRAMGADGYWASNELAIPVFSIKPVYLRLWFILSIILSLTAIVFLLFRWRLWRLRRSKQLLEAEVARRVLQIERDRRIIARQKAHLEEMNAAKDKLFSFVGHELRGPLMYFGNIANRISFALQQKDHESLAKLGERVKNMAISTNNMLDNLLNWSMLQGGKLSFGKGPSEARAVILQVLETYQEVAALKKLRIENETEPGLYVHAGPGGLAILLQNLISNAIKFSSEGGAVFIRTQKYEKQLAIEVEDQGMGMPPEKMKQLFSGSIQPSTKGTAGERGAGLGLQIVREIIRRFDGELKVKSREGKGSTFTLVLPLAEGGGGDV